MKDIKYIKTQIRDYVKDHYKYYGFYPYDVEVDNILYSYEQYMDILSMTVYKVSHRGLRITYALL